MTIEKRFGWVAIAVFCVAAGAAGAVLRGLLPPFVVDAPFWRAFLSGPPAAGLFAVLAAGIAFYPAYRSTRIARENAAREQWWNRAEWALGLAASSTDTDRQVANEALLALLEEATDMESRMILGVTGDLQGRDTVENRARLAENGKRGRRWPWGSTD